MRLRMIPASSDSGFALCSGYGVICRACVSRYGSNLCSLSRLLCVKHAARRSVFFSSERPAIFHCIYFGRDQEIFCLLRDKQKSGKCSSRCEISRNQGSILPAAS